MRHPGGRAGKPERRHAPNLADVGERLVQLLQAFRERLGARGRQEVEGEGAAILGGARLPRRHCSALSSSDVRARFVFETTKNDPPRKSRVCACDIKLQGWSFALSSFGERFAEKSGELRFGFVFAFDSRKATCSEDLFAFSSAYKKKEKEKKMQ
jgi:hypothetical protein